MASLLFFYVRCEEHSEMIIPVKRIRQLMIRFSVRTELLNSICPEADKKIIIAETRVGALFPSGLENNAIWVKKAVDGIPVDKYYPADF